MPQTFWERTKAGAGTTYSKALKPGFDKAWQAMDKLGAPVNRLTNKLGSEAFWPTTMDKESDKAARILRSFCKDGFYSKIDEAQAKKAEDSGEKIEGPQGKQRVLKKIPQKVIQNAVGLAIFTTMRTGLWVSGAGGSGVLLARHPETREWSPPSGILLHTAGLGFLIGVDIYDCVIVINSYKALEAFTKVRCTLGGEISAVAGPVGLGGVLESELHKRQAPVWTYLKSRGFYAGVQVDGTIVIERNDENETFYREKIGVADILAGKARYPPIEKYKMLMDTVHAAQGDDVDETLLPESGTAPGDQEIEGKPCLIWSILHLANNTPGGTSFGIPEPDDPDPYGVKALEAEGLAIREAGTHQRPSVEAFQFNPAPTSPIYATFRNSIDSPLRDKARTNSWRGSTASLASVTRGTQTEDDEAKGTTHSPLGTHSPARKETEHVDDNDRQDDLSDDDDDDDEHAEIATATPVVTKARVVAVPKRVPPSLPPRNPDRMSTPIDGFDQISLHDAQSKHDENNKPAAEPTGDIYDHSKAPEHEPKQVDDDDFHSMPPTPAEEEMKGAPATFN
jgi:lipid-binding SYLF domain-containing protein